jgi:subfamily B ATP-binding cassette protein MsbA
MSAAAAPAGSRDLYLRLLGFVKPYTRRLALSLLALIALGATEPLLPLALKAVFDGGFRERGDPAALLLPSLIVALFLARGVLGYIGRVAMQWVGNRVVMDLRARMFGRLVMLPARYFDAHSAGELISRLGYDAAQVSLAATQALKVAAEDSIRIVALLVAMLVLNPWLSLVVLALAPPIGWVMLSVSRRLRDMSRRVQDSMGALSHVAEEAIKGHRVVKVYAGQAYETERFGRAINDARKYAMKVVMAAAANVPVIQLIIALGLAALIYIAADQVARGVLSAGDFAAFFSSMILLLPPAKRLAAVNEYVQRGLAAAESVFGFIDESVEEDAGTIDIGRALGALRFADVSFAYEGGGRPALQGVSLEVAAGETVALVGASGSGKSTLVNLLPRFHAPQRGAVYLDGVDIATIRLERLRANIAFVSQDVVLFDDTVRNNIAYGAMRGASDAEVVAAARAAHVLEFATALPEGLDTPVGDRGARLSGGERQRLAIARALLKDAPVLILDEATSSLDSVSERHIRDALERLRRGRTCLVIAHRLSTVESADRIAVLAQGRIVELGTHRELLARGGAYADLYRSQFSGELPAVPLQPVRAR